MEFAVKNTKFIGFVVVVVDQRYYLTGSVPERPEIGELEVGNTAHAQQACFQHQLYLSSNICLE